MRMNELAQYRRFWEEATTQPPVTGPDDFWFQQLARYVRAIACEATRPFAIPVGITAEVAGLSPEFVGAQLGELVHHGVIRVVEYGAPGKRTRYAWTARPRFTRPERELVAT